MIDIDRWASYLEVAEDYREAVAAITDTEPELTVDEAYLIQRELLNRRVLSEEKAAVQIGVKLGLTSKAKQQAMGVFEPIYGWLSDAMLLGTEEPLDVGDLIHPRVEPEIAFVLRDDLPGPGVTVHDVLAATAGVCCALEVIDSRYIDFRFTAADVIADNCSAARFVLGSTLVRPDFDLRLTGCVFEHNGSLIDTAAGAAILGHPAQAVALLANRLAMEGDVLEGGMTVLSGGLMNAVAIAAGDHVTAAFGRLGSIALRAVRSTVVED